MDDEGKFIHDIVNKLSIVNGKLNRIIKKHDQFSTEELAEMASTAKLELDLAFQMIDSRVKYKEDAA